MNIKRSTKPQTQKKLFDEKNDEELKQDVEETFEKKIDTLDEQRKDLEKSIDKTISKIKEWRKNK